LLKVEAVNRGGAALNYRLKSGAFNELPQGLQLLPSGEIAGRVTFNTFAVDLGFTTFDRTQSNITGVEETTFDSEFVFTVNAYSPDPSQDILNVSSVTVINGGSGYSSVNLPILEFSSPVGATASHSHGHSSGQWWRNHCCDYDYSRCWIHSAGHSDSDTRVWRYRCCA
jgi:hypothetical protein